MLYFVYSNDKVYRVDFRTIKFVAIAGILYGVFYGIYTYVVQDDYLRKTIYPTIIGHPSAAVINTITPDRNATVHENKISSRKAVLNIVRGCDGSGVWFMLMAAVLGFGARFKDTIVGLLLGTLVVYFINQVRIIGLFYLVEWKRHLFPVVHTYYAPTLIILLIAGFFLWWTQWSMRHMAEQPVDKTGE